MASVSLLVAVLAVCVLSTTVFAAPSPVEARGDISPPVWPQEFSVPYNFTWNGTLSEGWLFYDWDIGRMRMDFEVCFGRVELGQCRLLFEGPSTLNVWLILPNTPALACCNLPALRGMVVPPTWLDHASYLGSQRVNGHVSDLWLKSGYLYADDRSTLQPVQLAATRSGISYVFDFADWWVAPLNTTIFATPASCLRNCPPGLLGVEQPL